MRLGAVALTALLVVACGGPGKLLELADARSDRDASRAVEQAADVLAGRRRASNERLAAALTLGRLRRATPDAVSALAVGLSHGGPADLRRASAWALGELRDQGSLAVLLRALRGPMPVALGRYVLQAVAKHQAVLAGSPDDVVEVVEAMNAFLGAVPTHEVPPIFDLLGARLRTLEVDVQVLARASAAHDRDPSPETRAALYSGAFELMSRLDELRAELGGRGPNPRAEEAIRAAVAAVARAEPRSRDLVLWFLGQLADAEVYARAAGTALASWPVERRGPARRLIRAWGLARTGPAVLDARRSLARQVLLQENDADVLRAWVQAVPAEAAEDALQRVLGVEVR